MTVPVVIADLLRGGPQPDAQEQAFPFLTVDAEGYPHVALLSRAELDIDDAAGEVLAVVTSTGTRGNLARDGRAALIAIEGTTAHYVKLQLTRSFEEAGAAACGFEVTWHKADTLGIPLEPIRFPATDEVARIERWEVSERLLAELGAAR